MRANFEEQPKRPRKPSGAVDYADAARLREALRHFHRRSEKVTRAHKLTPQRYELLLMIETAREGDERITLGELVDRLQLAASTVTELVHRCEDAGLVRREVDGRRRGILYVRATREGKRRLARAWGELQTDRDRLTSILQTIDFPNDDAPS